MSFGHTCTCTCEAAASIGDRMCQADLSRAPIYETAAPIGDRICQERMSSNRPVRRLPMGTASVVDNCQAPTCETAPMGDRACAPSHWCGHQWEPLHRCGGPQWEP
ncbi:hypothetical protein DEU56DRAFT_756366 [Suillus clintonianus]|uniref:uncharacterized protein n=1 Tax=Suillus clintonianus TaxID=1904413 RepID=UPI001B87D7D5|nr:uncharacterized protein DEU56DRAFT_756366 [Suillus clintonianus]KAG2136467.1 hypothetical protein DEU56DRAFT_756366 [Suillus clintonianus]